MKLKRPLIYVLAVVVIILIYARLGPFKNNEQVNIPLPPDPITKEQIFKDFIDLRDNEMPVEPVLGGTFYTTALRFKPGFKGVEGDHFYAAIEDGHVAYILEYKLKELYDRRLVYQVSRVIEGSSWPSEQGELYIRSGGTFKLQK